MLYTFPSLSFQNGVKARLWWKGSHENCKWWVCEVLINCLPRCDGTLKINCAINKKLFMPSLLLCHQRALVLGSWFAIFHLHCYERDEKTGSKKFRPQIWHKRVFHLNAKCIVEDFVDFSAVKKQFRNHVADDFPAVFFKFP